MTGILNPYKNDIFSDPSNLKTYSLSSDKHSQSFGFSEPEVQRLFSENNLNVNLQEVKRWYNGYHSEHTGSVYNPWSILNCLNKKGALGLHWNHYRDIDLLKRALSNHTLQEGFKTLVLGESIQVTMNNHISFEQVTTGTPEVIWGLLLAYGYLKAVDCPAEPNKAYQLKIPNLEIQSNYEYVLMRSIRELDKESYDTCVKRLREGDVEKSIIALERFLLSFVIFFDLNSEKDHYAIFLTLALSLQDTDLVNSNREVGLGRSALVLTSKPKIDSNLGIVLEFKRAQTDKNLEDYQKLAAAGLQQIEDKKYDVDLKNNPTVQRILKVCLVFHGKQVAYQYTIDTL